VRDNKTFRIDSSIQTGRKFGMQLLDDHLWTLYSKGIISPEEMIDKGKNPADLTDKVHRIGRTVGRIELDESEDLDEASAPQ
jgi:twitching motility protein PilT